MLELAAAIGESVGRSLELTFAPARPGDVPHSQADISVAAARLGYRVLVPFAEGIRLTVVSYKDSAPAPAPAPPPAR